MRSHETYDAARTLSPAQQQALLIALCTPRHDPKVDAFWRAVANDVANARDDERAAFNAITDDTLGIDGPDQGHGQ